MSQAPYPRTAPAASGAAAARPARAVPPSGGAGAALRVVEDASQWARRRALTRAATLLAATLACAGLFGVVFLQVLLAQGQSELDHLQQRRDVASAQNGRLRVQVASLESPERVVALAKGRLGMVAPASVIFLAAADPSIPLPPVPGGPLPLAGPPATTAGAPSAGTKSTPTTVARAGTPAATATTAPTTPTTTTKATATPTTVARPAAVRPVTRPRAVGAAPTIG